MSASGDQPGPERSVPRPPGTPEALTWRELDSADLEAVSALHRLSIQGVGPEVVKREQTRFFESLLAGRGWITGVFEGSELVAYGVLQQDLLPEDDPREHLGLPADVIVRKLAGAAVAPRWRGVHLQRALVEHRLRLAGADAVAIGTAAPGNPASWRTATSCAMAVRALELRYGGHPRYLMARVPALLDDPASPDTAEIEVPALDLARLGSLLSEGWRGLGPGSVSESGATLRMRLHPRAASHAAAPAPAPSSTGVHPPGRTAG